MKDARERPRDCWPARVRERYPETGIAEIGGLGVSRIWAPRYDAMCRAIDAAYQVDEVKDIRDKALAIEHYSRQAKNTEAERRACEIRLRAERKCGQLLAEVERSKGGRPDNSAQPELSSYSQAKAEAGISDSQAERWQQLAAVPEDQFEAALGAVRT